MFISNVSSMFLYFVCKVFDENTGKVSTRVNCWQYFRWMFICEYSLFGAVLYWKMPELFFQCKIYI